MFFTIIALSGLGALGAAATFLALRMRSAALRPAQQTGQRFGQIEDKIRSLKSAQKLTDPVAALEIVATDIDYGGGNIWHAWTFAEAGQPVGTVPGPTSRASGSRGGGGRCGRRSSQ